MRPKRSFLLLSSDAFWKFSVCKVYRKGFGRNFTIYVSKNEVVSCKVWTHFGSFHLARYTTKVLGALSRFLHPRTKLFAMKFRRFWMFSPCKLHKKVMGALSRFLPPKIKLFAVEFGRILEVYTSCG